MNARLLPALALVLAFAACQTDTPPPPSTPPPAPPEAPAPPPPAEPVTVVEMTPGDRGCYLTVAEASGEAVMHLADYALCERADLVGQRVALSTETRRVQATVCQGDPECTQSETVALVTDARVVE